MNKIKKVIEFCNLLIKQPSLINLITNSKQKWEKQLQKTHPNQTQLPTIDIKNFINKTTNLNTVSFLGGGSLITDILLLKYLCQKFTNCTYFEIGTWRGESVVNVAEVAKECYTLNLPKNKIIELGLSKKYADLHSFFSKDKKNITHLFGDTLTFNFKALNKKFDVIFIDGNHTYKYVKKDTENVFKHLAKKDSIVVWHDYAYNPEEVRSETLAGILAGTPKEFRNKLYHVSNTLCAIYYPDKINSSILNFPVEPNKNFNVSIKFNSLKNN